MEPKDYEAVAQALIGRRIVETRKVRSLSTVDNGYFLRAAATDGGCSCGNGDWSVSAPDIVGDAVITAVSASEELGSFSEHGDGEAVLRLFVYQDTIKTEIVSSKGFDNGYYGWGYELLVLAEAKEEKN